MNSYSQSTNADGFAFNAGVDNETDLVFRTTGAAASAPALSLNSIGFPAGTIYPGGGLRCPYPAATPAAMPWERVRQRCSHPIRGRPFRHQDLGAAGNIVLVQGTPGDSGAGFVGGMTFSPADGAEILRANSATVTPGTYYIGGKLDRTGVVSGNTGTTLAWSASQITITAKPAAQRPTHSLATRRSPSKPQGRVATPCLRRSISISLPPAPPPPRRALFRGTREQHPIAYTVTV